MIYEVPELELYNVLRFEKDLEEQTPDEEFIFDFSNMRKFDPLPMLMVGSIIRRYRKLYPAIPFKLYGLTDKTYAGTMGFFKYISESINFGKSPGEAQGSSGYIPITEININLLQEQARLDGNASLFIGNIIEEKASRLARIVDRGNPELHMLFTYLIREIIRNIPEHAAVNNLWICGQYWPSYQLAEIAIIDEGIGIYKSLTSNPSHAQYIADNLSALQWSLKAGISQSFRPAYKPKLDDVWENSGFGLYMASQICQKLNGSFCIISYSDALLIDNHALSSYGLPILVEGDLRSHIIIIAIENGDDIDKLNDMLANAGFPLLKTSPDMPSAKITDTFPIEPVKGSHQNDKHFSSKRRIYRELESFIDGQHNGGNAPFDYDYQGWIKLQDEAGQIFQVEAVFKSEYSSFIVFTEEQRKKLNNL